MIVQVALWLTLSLMEPGCPEDSPTLAENAAATRPLDVGATIPELTLKNARGESIKLASLRKDRALVLIFFRGGWCPFCVKHTAELIRVYPEVKNLGAEIVGISPDDVKRTQENVTKSSIPFPVLSDADVAAAKAFGLAFKVDDETLNRYRGFGIDLEKTSGFNHHALPVPAVFIVDKSGKIVFAHSDPDYRKRLKPSRIIDELKKLN